MTRLFMALVLLGGAPGLAAAVEDRDGGPHRTAFDRLDADGSGTVSADEWAQRSEERFARLDANGDGEISESEFDARRRGRGGRGTRPARPR